MADIWITHHRLSDKRNICATSPRGTAWIWSNMELKVLDDKPVVVDADGIQEIVNLMKKDGLTVEER